MRQTTKRSRAEMGTRNGTTVAELIIDIDIDIVSQSWDGCA
jgi:hypothetical protein